MFAAFADVLELWHVLDDRVPTSVPPPSSDATRDLFEVAATAPLGPLDAQRVLEATPESRAQLLEQLLTDLGEELRSHRLRVTGAAIGRNASSDRDEAGGYCAGHDLLR